MAGDTNSLTPLLAASDEKAALGAVSLDVFCVPQTV